MRLAFLALFVAVATGFSISNTLGNHMVLQRSPYGAVVWGFANAGVVVTTVFNSAKYTSIADSSGIWRQSLPPTPEGGPYTITFTASDGGSGSLTDVLFGDVFLCGGQSNMQFTISLANNASAEIATADSYPNIRVFTVGQGNSSNTPFTNLASIEQTWAVASKASVGGPDWGYQSAVCWLFGRTIFDNLGGKIPIGLINNNWGGTTIQQWSSDTAAKVCGQTGSGNLWNAMIVPYTVGPMAMKGVTWYQGESNVGQDTYYACQFPATITDWRTNFQNPNLWWGFIQIAGYNYGPGPSPADLRVAQLAALSLPAVGYASAIDVGNANDIHPTDKQTVAYRLANCALDQLYGFNIPWQHPLYQSAKANTSGTTVTVTISFKPGTIGTGLTTTVPAPALAMQANQCLPPLDPTTECGWPTITLNDSAGTTLNATATLTDDKQGIILTATAPASGLQAAKTSYGRAGWAVTTFFNSYGLPVIPWYSSV